MFCTIPVTSCVQLGWDAGGSCREPALVPSGHLKAWALCEEVTQRQQRVPGRAREVLGQAEGLGVPGRARCATALPGQLTPNLGHPTPRNATPGVCVCRCVMHKHQGSLHEQATPWERLPGQCWDNSVLSLSLQTLGVREDFLFKLS